MEITTDQAENDHITLRTTDYHKATAREARLRKAADQAAAERASELAKMHACGISYGKIAEATGLSRSRVQQLVEKGGI